MLIPNICISQYIPVYYHKIVRFALLLDKASILGNPMFPRETVGTIHKRIPGWILAIALDLSVRFECVKRVPWIDIDLPHHPLCYRFFQSVGGIKKPPGFPFWLRRSASQTWLENLPFYS